MNRYILYVLKSRNTLKCVLFSGKPWRLILCALSMHFCRRQYRVAYADLVAKDTKYSDRLQLNDMPDIVVDL